MELSTVKQKAWNYPWRLLFRAFRVKMSSANQEVGLGKGFSDWSRGQKVMVIGAGAFFGLAALTAFLPEPAQPPKGAAPEFIVMSGLDNYAMIFPADSDPGAIADAARAKCFGKQICQVLGWTDKADAAPRLPMLDREVEALAFRYALNRNTSYEEVGFACKRLPKAPKDSCLD